MLFYLVLVFVGFSLKRIILCWRTSSTIDVAVTPVVAVFRMDIAIIVVPVVIVVFVAVAVVVAGCYSHCCDYYYGELGGIERWVCCGCYY